MLSLHQGHDERPFAAEPGRDASSGCGRCATGEQLVGEIELGGRRCRVMLVDGVIPGHSAASGTQRVRLTYLPGEIAHFDFSGHRYALVVDKVVEPAVIRGQAGPLGSALDIDKLLTARELQIVQLVCMGYLTKQVADRLGISEFTVRSYLKTVYAKLGVRTRAALVFRYMKAFGAGAETSE